MAKQSYYGDPYNQGDDFNWTTKFGEQPKTEGDKLREEGVGEDGGFIDRGELAPDGTVQESSIEDIQSDIVKRDQLLDAQKNKEFDRAVEASDKAWKRGNTTVRERIEQLLNAPNAAFKDLQAGAEGYNRQRQLGIDSAAQTVDDIVTGGLEKLNVPGSEYIGDRARNITGFLTDVAFPTAEDIALSGVATALATPAAGGVTLAALRMKKFGDEAVDFFTKIPTIISHQRGGRLGLKLADGQFTERSNLSKIFMDDQLAKQSAQPMRMTGGGSGFKSSILKSKYAKNFNEKDLLDFEDAAYQHRIGRPKGKRNLMKDFDYKGSGEPYVFDKQQEPYILIRKRGASKIRDETTKAKLKAADPRNFQLIPLKEQINRLARRSGWTKGAKDMDELKKALNQMGPNPAFYEPLMQHGDAAYLEHKIGKGADWFWEQRKKDKNFASWLDPKITRNSEGNIRLLFNDSFQRLKDTVEKKVKSESNKIKNLNARYIIDLEDPISGDFAKRSNPGNLAVKRVSDGTTIGVIPDYLQELYTKDFTDNFNYKNLIDRPGNPVPEFYRAEIGETGTDYVNRILKERLDLILAKQTDTSVGDIGVHVIQDTSDFYNLFANQLEWVRRPEYIDQQIKNWK